MATNKALITAAFSTIPSMFLGFDSGRELLVAECAASERGHRRHRSGPYSLSVVDAARYFAIKYLYECLTGVRQPLVSDYLHIRHEIFTAAALSVQFADKLRSEWAEPYKAQIEAVLAIDYAEMME